MKMIYLMCLLLMGCGCGKMRDSRYADVHWYELPYDIPRERGVIKSFHNQELAMAKSNIVCPFSALLNDANGKHDPLTRVRIAYFNGGCSIREGAALFQCADEKYHAGKNKVWVVIRCVKLPETKNGCCEMNTVSEITEEEFFKMARTVMPSARVIEFDRRRVVIGGCGRLKGYVLKDYITP